MAYTEIAPGTSLRASQSLMAANDTALRTNEAGTSTPSSPESGQLQYRTDKDAIFLYDSSFATSHGSSAWAGVGTVIRKFTVAFGDLSEASNGVAEDVSLVTLPANSIVHTVRAKSSTAFAAPSLASLGLTVGDSGSASRYLSTYDLTAAVADTNLGQETNDTQLSAASFAVVARFTPDGGEALADLTAGSVDIYVRYSVIE